MCVCVLGSTAWARNFCHLATLLKWQLATGPCPGMHLAAGTHRLPIFLPHLMRTEQRMPPSSLHTLWSAECRGEEGGGRWLLKTGSSLDIKVANFQLEEFSTRRLGTFVTLQLAQKIPEAAAATTRQNRRKKEEERREKG